MKIVINQAFGAFSIPASVCEAYAIGHYADIERTDALLVTAVEGGDDNGGELVVVEIPDGSHYIITDYDGAESVFYSQSEIYSA